MLSDPISLTYNGNAKSLARAPRPRTGVRKVVGRSGFTSDTGEFVVETTSMLMSDRSRKVEITLYRNPPYSGSITPPPQSEQGNGVSLCFIVNENFNETVTDIPLIRAALLAYVDSTIQSKLLQGQI
jgi:hypothetical protein